ncbi:hypothetical protein [Pseudoalteromonas sp. Of11M-6]|nr:hypothetical protein [Pseudoalteromonas sp. Of11M-6]
MSQQPTPPFELQTPNHCVDAFRRFSVAPMLDWTDFTSLKLSKVV